MARERDVRNAIAAALEATDSFGEISLIGLPEAEGFGASNLAAVSIEPDSTVQADRYDGGMKTGLVNTARLKLTFLARNPDPQACDEACEDLLDTAINAIQGQSLGGFTLPDHTRFSGWKWEPRTPPERRITAMFAYDYFVDGWDEYDTAD